MQRYPVNPVEVPEDVRAELDVEDRRLVPEALPTADAVPEDTCSELDREARLADAELELQLAEGRQPAPDDEAVEA